MTNAKNRAKKILIIEDDEQMHIAYRSMFVDSENEYEIELEKNATVAYSKFKSGEFDMAILDIIMEPMSGEMFYVCARDDKDCPNIPILVVSVINHKDLEHLKKINNIQFLQKPIMEEDLMEKVKKMCGK
ncbi:MAG: response regulator [Candidatus Tantalella remota]|nr:response regulator [Candidatus Tantalella remota]